jgi:2-methylfumaryl-CoA hydratase
MAQSQNAAGKSDMTSFDPAQHRMVSEQRWFEDFVLGERFVIPSRTQTSAVFAAFQTASGDTHPIHYDVEYCRARGMPDLLAHGFQTLVHTAPGAGLFPYIVEESLIGFLEQSSKFLKPVYAGDTLIATSEVIGLRENANKTSGVVYVRTTGRNQHGERVLEYVRWVMVRKRDKASPAPTALVPDLAERVEPADLGSAVPPLDLADYDFALAGSPYRWSDYAVGEKIDHIDAMTLEEAEHQIATRLYQNTAKVHFNLHEQAQGQFKRRLVYGGVVISLARALSFNGLANAFHIAAINGGRHVSPLFAGATVFAWSEVLTKADVPGRDDVGALRLRTVAAKDHPCADFPLKSGAEDDPAVLLDLDYWALMPR